MVCVLKGAFIFLADLVRHMSPRSRSTSSPCSSYDKGTTSSGEVRFLKDLDESLDGKDVDDRRGHRRHRPDPQLPAGNSPRPQPARSLRTACLLSKPSRRKVDVKVEYIGFTIEDKFVVGYGLDYESRYRNLPYIAVLE